MNNDAEQQQPVTSSVAVATSVYESGILLA